MSVSEIVPLDQTQEHEFEKEHTDAPVRSSTRELLESKFAEINSDDEEITTEEETPAAPSGRDEKGRFTSTRAAMEAAAKGKDFEAHTEDGGETIEQEIAPASEPVAPSAPVEAPSSWAADEREAFASAPPKAQQAIIRRETESRRAIHQATEEAAQVKRTWAEVDSILAPKREILARHGKTEADAVRQLMGWQDYMDRDPKSALRELAGSYGLNLRQLAEEEAQQPQEPPYVRQLQQQLGQVQQFIQNTQQQTQAQQQQALVNSVLAFQNEKDAAGNLLRPHMEQVAAEMVQLVQIERAKSPQTPLNQLLQGAYEKAIWLNPSTRELEVKRAAPISKLADPVKVARARQAKKLVNGAAISDAAPAPKPRTTRAALEANWEKQNQ